jgi:hypothetical protein
MNKNKTIFPCCLGVLTSIVSISTATILGISERVLAKTPSQIAQVAIPVTVQINSLKGGGSGVIVEKENKDGQQLYTVLTANHVVKDVNLTYEVRTHTGQVYTASSVKHFQQADSDPDLALVTFSSTDEYPVARLGDSTQEQLGDKISIFGYPYIDEQLKAEDRPFVYAPGVLNSLNRKGPNGYNWLYDAVTQKGMSGGPVFNNEGQIVAVHGRGERFEEKAAFNAGIPINTLIALDPSFQSNLIATSKTSPNESGTNPVPAPPADSADETIDRYAGASQFYCDISGDVPKTMARNVVSNATQVLIRWEADPNFQWGVDRQTRCQTVSGRFQKAYYDNTLDFLVVGQVKNYPVVCGVADEGNSCSSENILITFQPGTNAQEWLEKFLAGQEMAVRSVGGATSMRALLSNLRDPLE